MKLKTIQTILDAEVLVKDDHWENLEITAAGGSDLMSDVLSFMRPDTLLLTGLVNAQVIRTAEVADIRAVCFVRGKKPDGEILELAVERGIPVLYTQLPMFESCGRLYMNGLRGTYDE